MTKRVLTILSLVTLFLISRPAVAQKYQDGLIDKTIALIGNDMIMISDIEGEVQMMRANGYIADQRARCEILENSLVSKLFLTQAKLDSLTVTETDVQSQVSQRVDNVASQLGGEKQVEEYFGKPMYKLRQEWSDVIREQLLIQQMQRNVVSELPKLTPSDIKEYYKKTPEEDLPVISTQYILRQIVLYPDKKAAATLVKEKLLELRERIINGEKFSTLARVYSEDPGSSSKGGELGMLSKSYFWPAFSDAAMALKIGQVSQIVETPDGFHIIQMVDREGDMFNARHILIKPKYTDNDRSTAFTRLDSIKNVITENKMTFEIAAWNYSQDLKTRTNGGLMVDANTGSSLFEKDQLKPADYAILKDMKVGDISEPFESTDNEGRNGQTVYKIIMLDKVIPSHTANYETDYNVLVDDATNKNATTAIDKFISEKQKTTYILIDPLFRGCDFQREGWIK